MGRRNQFWGRRFTPVLICTIFLLAVSAAQVTQVMPVDIAGGFRARTVHATFDPPYIGDTLKAFDGNQFLAVEVLHSDTLTFTLNFDSLVQFEKSKVFFWHDAKWTLESSNSLADLNSKSGSYQKEVGGRLAATFMWDSLSFASQRASYVRLSVKNPGDSSVRLGEWTLEGSVKFVKYLIIPQPLRLIPGSSMKLSVRLVDEQNSIYPNFLGGLVKWSSTAPDVVLVDEDGRVTGKALGSSIIAATNSSQTLKGSVTAWVEQDFRGQKVAPMVRKVVLVNQDPRLQNGNRIHQEFGWRDPNALADRLVQHFLEATDSVVQFQIVERVDAAILFTRFYGNFLGVTKYVQLLHEPGWPTLKAAADSGQIWFDYREFVKYYKFDQRRNNGEIDEVWVFAAPYLGMYESQLMGPKAFWWNSPPIKDGTALTKLLSVMGLNYERGVDQAFHSFGHRVESAVTQAYLEAQGRNWDPKSTNPTPWDLFTRIEKDMPGLAHVGNVHFPPNGDHDYDYGNQRVVTSYAENWFRYPLLFEQHSQVSAATWYYAIGDPLAEGNDHLGYLRWFYGHLPRYLGVTDGVLNNWWHYALDYEEAVALARITPVVGVSDRVRDAPPRLYGLEQNFPNPFNPSTTITFTAHSRAFTTLRVYDVLGREVATLVNEPVDEGLHAAYWNAAGFPSGVYYYRLQTGNFSETKGMVLLK